MNSTCLDECFLFLVITERYFFCKILSAVWDFFNHGLVALFGKSVLGKFYILHHLLNESTVLTVCFSDEIIPIYFLCLSKVWSILHLESVCCVHKKMLVNASICLFFVAFFCCIFRCIFLLLFFVAFVIFLHKICVSIMLFSDEVSNFGNRILTNKKHELVVSNCQWNCILIPSLNFINFLNYFITTCLTLFNFVTVPRFSL